MVILPTFVRSINRITEIPLELELEKETMGTIAVSHTAISEYVHAPQVGHGAPHILLQCKYYNGAVAITTARCKPVCLDYLNVNILVNSHKISHSRDR